MIKVSIIIPIYNVEKYLKKCLDSVINQTLEDIEIICINDCSTDDSLGILKEYSSKDKRIKLIDLPQNKGAGNARNKGIEIAGGEYIGFLDGDDYPENDDFYEKLYNCATENNADISKGAYKNSDKMTVDENINKRIKENKEYFCSTYCSAIFKSELIKNNDIKFPLISDMEDPCFTSQASRLANKVIIVDDCNLIITKRRDSATGKLPNLEQVKDKVSGLEILFENNYADYVLAYWFVTVVLDSLKNFNLDVEEYVLYKCSKLFEKKKNNHSFIQNVVKIKREIYEYFYNNKAEYFFNKAELKKEIDKHDVISFDIFDTLLLRPFNDPKDLFLYMQETENVTDFAMMRSIGERRARIIAKNREDITFDEIYKSINPKYKNLKQTEKDFEYKLLQPNKEMLEIYNYALSQGKKVIITSDMYFDREFLTQVLNKNGFKNFHRLFVSSEIGKCKYTGNLYKHIINDLNINAARILHIGDNYRTDYIIAKKIGLSSYYYKNIVERLRNLYNKHSIPLEFFNEESTIYTNRATALQLLYRHNNRFDCTYFENIGFIYGGVLGVAFANELRKIAKTRRLTDIFFIARDGYMLKNIFDMLYPDTNVKTHYIYAQRKLRNLCIKSPDNSDYNAECAREYKEYTGSIKTKGKKIGIADSCAGGFSAQTLLESYMPDYEFIGIYIAAVINYKYNYINLSIKNHCNKSKLGFHWDFIELLFTSEEPPIEKIVNNQPVYREIIRQEEISRREVYKEIRKGIIEFVTYYNQVFGNEVFYADISEIFGQIETFWKNLNTIDIIHLNKIQHPIDSKEQYYVSLLSPLKERIKLFKKMNLCKSERV